MVAEVISINNQVVHQVAAIKDYKNFRTTIGKHEQETDIQLQSLTEYSYLAHLVV